MVKYPLDFDLFFKVKKLRNIQHAGDRISFAAEAGSRRRLFGTKGGLSHIRLSL